MEVFFFNVHVSKPYREFHCHIQVEAEVVRLGEVKASKMKELVMKKRSELEEICRKTHMLPVSDSAMDQTIVAIESGIVDATLVLEHLEQHISKVKEEALSRKEILEKVEKWLSACDEESWLEEYNRVRAAESHKQL